MTTPEILESAGNILGMLHDNASAFAEQMQQRFERNNAPPPYKSKESTRQPSLAPPDEQKHQEQESWYLEQARQASQPIRWFRSQVDAERKRIWASAREYDLLRQNNTIPTGGALEDTAIQRVRDRWKEEGIWYQGWNETGMPEGPWPHELSLESMRGSQSSSSLFAPLRRRSEDEQEGNNIPLHTSQASCPGPQFLMEMRRQWLCLANDAVATQDLGWKSYDAAKAQWKKWGVPWVWGSWPGAKWPHEMDSNEVRLLSTERQSNSPARFPPQSQDSVSVELALPTTTQTPPSPPRAFPPASRTSKKRKGTKGVPPESSSLGNSEPPRRSTRLQENKRRRLR